MSADLVAQLQVLSKESGCLLNLSALLDLSICPSISIQTNRPHKTEDKDDYVFITPSETSETHYKRCNDGSCYQAPKPVPEQVCKSNTVALDLQILIFLGLLTHDEVEQYLHKTGALGENESLPKCDAVKVDPLITADIGDNGDILDLDLLGPDGLLNVDLLQNSNGEPLLNLDLLGSDGLLNLDLLSNRKRSTDKLIDVDALTQKDPAGEEALIDVDLLTTGKGSNNGAIPGDGAHDDGSYDDGAYGNGAHYRRGLDKLLDVDALTDKDPAGHEALIDVDLLTKGKGRNDGAHYRRSTERLLDVDALTDKNSDEALIDVDLLTKGKDSGSFRRSVDKLLDIDALTDKDSDEALIDVDLLTRGKDRFNGHHYRLARRASGRLLDLDILTSKDKPGNEALIDVDLLTKGSNEAVPATGNENDNGYPVYPGNESSYGNSGQYMSHYQPICKKALKPEYRDTTTCKDAINPNQCLAICHSEAVRATLKANPEVGDAAQILVCAAVEFDQNATEQNCRILIAPENKPCEDDYLEDSDNCYSFVRN